MFHVGELRRRVKEIRFWSREAVVTQQHLERRSRDEIGRYGENGKASQRPRLVCACVDYGSC